MKLILALFAITTFITISSADSSSSEEESRPELFVTNYSRDGGYSSYCRSPWLSGLCRNIICRSTRYIGGYCENENCICVRRSDVNCDMTTTTLATTSSTSAPETTTTSSTPDSTTTTTSSPETTTPTSSSESTTPTTSTETTTTTSAQETTTPTTSSEGTIPTTSPETTTTAA